MTSSADAAADQAHSMMQDLADHWGLVVVMGVAGILLGFLAMFYPGATIVTVATLRRLAVRQRHLRGHHVVHA